MAKYRFRALGAILLALGIASLLLSQWAAPTQAKGDYIGVARIDGAIDAISSRYLSRAINKAEGDEAVLIVIELDTPGGRLDSTRDMVATILESRSPVAVYVTPSGAQAASAGTFITAAANFAVMEPTTNIGAASPISGSGEDLPSTLERKVIEDTRAFIRAISERRDRNAEALEATVTHARAYSATEALDLGVIDFIAPDLEDLLAQVDGRTAETAAGPVVVNTDGVRVRDINMSFLERFLAVIADPNIAFTLISLGSLALIIEFWIPGFGPGIIGVIMLALAFVAFGQLPVNWVGVALILFSNGPLLLRDGGPRDRRVRRRRSRELPGGRAPALRRFLRVVQPPRPHRRHKSLACHRDGRFRGQYGARVLLPRAWRRELRCLRFP